MASPRGFAFGSLSGMVGRPVESENRAVTVVESRVRCGARDKDAASEEGVKVPVSKTPLAWAGRKPGCRPNIASNWASRSLASWISFSSDGRGILWLRFLLQQFDQAAMALQRFKAGGREVLDVGV